MMIAKLESAKKTENKRRTPQWEQQPTTAQPSQERTVAQASEGPNAPYLHQTLAPYSVAAKT